MQRHESVFEVDAPPRRVWRMFHPEPPADARVPRTIEHPGGAITIVEEGDEHGAGLVRTCTFPVPKWLLSGGVARSFEVVTEVRPNEYARYRAAGKPLWSEAEGWHTLEPLDDGGRTRVRFVETYHVHNPLLRTLFEARVHRFISARNHQIYQTVLAYVGPVTPISRH